MFGAVLTDVGRDDGEGAEVGLPHILGQGVGVLLVLAQQCCRATLRLLDQLPVRTGLPCQDGTAHLQQVLRERQRGEGSKRARKKGTERVKKVVVESTWGMKQWKIVHIY